MGEFFSIVFTGLVPVMLVTGVVFGSGVVTCNLARRKYPAVKAEFTNYLLFGFINCVGLIILLQILLALFNVGMVFQ